MTNQIICEYDFFDNINLTCNEHKIPCIGVCIENKCKERRLFCMKCVESRSCTKDTCHEINSIGNLFNNFFNKQSNDAIDLYELNNLMEIIKSIDRSELSLKLNDYSSNMKKSLDNFINSVYQSLEDEVELINIAFKDELNTIEDKYVNTLRNTQITSSDISDAIIKTNNIKGGLLSESTSFEDKIEILNTLKLFNNEKLIIEELDNIDNIIYISKLKEIDSLEKIFESKAEILINKVEENLEELKALLFPSTKEALLYVKDSCDKFESNPNDLVFNKNICETAHKSNSIDCVFTTFKSLKNDYYVIWGTPSFQICGYDLVEDKLAFTHLAHTSTIFSCRHYLDKRHKTDMIITSSYDKSVKVWNFTEGMKVMLNIQSAQSGYYIYSSTLLISQLEDSITVITSAPNEYQKIWTFKGEFVKEFGVNTDSTYFIDTWFNPKLKKYYILNANSVDIKIYNYPDLSLFKSYKATPQTWHMSAKVIERNDIFCLVESDGSGNIRIWDFYEGNNLLKVQTTGLNLRGICIWNDQYIFAASSDYAVKLYDIKEQKLSKSFAQHSSTVCAVEKICIPKLGECLVSHGLDGKLKLWSSSKLTN